MVALTWRAGLRQRRAFLCHRVAAGAGGARAGCDDGAGWMEGGACCRGVHAGPSLLHPCSRPIGCVHARGHDPAGAPARWRWAGRSSGQRACAQCSPSIARQQHAAGICGSPLSPRESRLSGEYGWDGVAGRVERARDLVLKPLESEVVRLPLQSRAVVLVLVVDPPPSAPLRCVCGVANSTPHRVC